MDERRSEKIERKTAENCRRNTQRNLYTLAIFNKCGTWLSVVKPHTASLSGGESQRIRLATQIGSQLVNVLLHSWRAEHRSSPMRQHQIDWHAEATARCGQFRYSGGTRWRYDTVGGLYSRFGSACRTFGRRSSVSRHFSRNVKNQYFNIIVSERYTLHRSAYPTPQRQR